MVFESIIIIFILIAIWDIVWKAIAMWKSARRNQLAWFIIILIFNTAGILPIIYLLIYREKPKPRKKPKAIKKIKKTIKKKIKKGRK